MLSRQAARRLYRVPDVTGLRSLGELVLEGRQELELLLELPGWIEEVNLSYNLTPLLLLLLYALLLLLKLVTNRLLFLPFPPRVGCCITEGAILLNN